jgi:16S rRNA (cytosine967-C5)-methyltransferase
MTPAARIAAAIEALEQIERSGAPPERALAAWGRANRYAGSKDRAAIADHVFDLLRRRRSLAWMGGGESARCAAIGLCVATDIAPGTVFTGERHAPPQLTGAEEGAIRDLTGAPDPVRLDYPDWLDRRLRDSLGARFEASMAALQSRAPVDLRVNTLRIDRDAARAALAAEGIQAAPCTISPTALRADPGAPVARTSCYRDGLVELQDAGSQAVADFAQARPSETVLDFCAGGGGKTLALAAAMGGRGRLIAHDVAEARMADLPARLFRAGARAEIMGRTSLDGLGPVCDLVFVDAPCSGSGSWRRDPAGKWRLDPVGLQRLLAAQREAIANARRFLLSGGRMVYATCSILSEENEAQAVAAPGLRMGPTLRLAPSDGCDGFFATILSEA